MGKKKSSAKKRRRQQTDVPGTSDLDLHLDAEMVGRELDELLRNLAPETEKTFASLPPSPPETIKQMNRRHAELGHLMLDHCRKTGDKSGIRKAEKILRDAGCVKQPDGTWKKPD